MIMQIIDGSEVFNLLKKKVNPFFGEYYALYSSWLGGVIKDPSMMLIPIDDHMVHRGDGVFEAMKVISGSIYLFEEHLTRLFLSAEKVALEVPHTAEELKKLIIQTLRIADKDEAIIRIYISRGPGNFSVNPYDSVGPQVYIAITKLHQPAAESYENGAVIGHSTIPVKASWLAQVKSCNYLPNVLMKKEAMDRGLDYVVGADEHGCITESATENVMIVDSNGVLVHPSLDCILKGTMMIRACELANQKGIKTEARPISIAEMKSAREVMMAGTSINVLPVVAFERQTIGDGRPGPIARQLLGLMYDDISNGPRRTPFN